MQQWWPVIVLLSYLIGLGFGVVSFLLLLVMFLGLQSLSSLKAGLTAANSTSQYAKATGLECLFGALYLAGRVERLNELFFVTMDEPHAL